MLHRKCRLAVKLEQLIKRCSSHLISIFLPFQKLYSGKVGVKAREPVAKQRKMEVSQQHAKSVNYRVITVSHPRMNSGKYKRLDMKHKCKKCGVYYKHIASLHNHLLLHNKEKIFTCSVCKEKRFTLDGIVLHKLKKHGVRCKVCRKRFPTATMLRAHRTVHTDMKRVCKECGRTFHRQHHYNRHIKMHRNTEIQKQRRRSNVNKFKRVTDFSDQRCKGKSHICLLCGENLASTTRLLEHIHAHTKMTPLRCRVCYRDFKDKESLWRHQPVHLMETAYVCGLCSNTFRTARQVKTHISDHLQDENALEKDLKLVSDNHGQEQKTEMCSAKEAEKQTPSTGKETTRDQEQKPKTMSTQTQTKTTKARTRKNRKERSLKLNSLDKQNVDTIDLTTDEAERAIIDSTITVDLTDDSDVTQSGSVQDSNTKSNNSPTLKGIHRKGNTNTRGYKPRRSRAFCKEKAALIPDCLEILQAKVGKSRRRNSIVKKVTQGSIDLTADLSDTADNSPEMIDLT